MRPGPLIGLIGAGLVIAALGIAGGGATAPGERGPSGAASADRLAAGPRAAVDPITGLARAIEPQGPVVRRASATIGHSASGRPITARAVNGTRDDGEAQSPGPAVLAIGCIHGDECAGIGAVRRAYLCRRPYDGDLIAVRNLNPDGFDLGSRLNSRGVDLNRNFATDWRPSGAPGDSEYPGPRPFSEPETRVARRLIRSLHPEVTIWFHQQAEPLVRAWGPSVRAARAYARLAGLPFAHMPWMNGTAPNWQNDRFPGTSSFVVELPLTGPTRPRRQARAILNLPRVLVEQEPTASDG